ncbi:alpha-L-fucosidase, partial [Amycolatopsis balhimycina DSM 5908]
PPAAPVTPAPHCPTAETATLNDDANGIVYSGSWYVAGRRGLGDFHDDVHATMANGSSVGYAFTGTGIALFSETYSDEGRMDIYLDEVFQRTVDTTSQARHAQQSVFSACGLSPGRHTIRAVKRSGTYMLLDRFDVTP